EGGRIEPRRFAGDRHVVGQRHARREALEPELAVGPGVAGLAIAAPARVHRRLEDPEHDRRARDGPAVGVPDLDLDDPGPDRRVLQDVVLWRIVEITEARTTGRSPWGRRVAGRHRASGRVTWRHRARSAGG